MRRGSPGAGTTTVNSTPQNVSILTDISANIFALLILFLIIMLAARESSPSPRTEAPEVIDLEKEFASVERSPLSGDELVDLLYERRAGAATTAIDLLEQSIDVVSGGKTEHFSSLENAAPRLRQLAAASNRLPAGVYVFSHRFYRGLAETLKALGWSWREVSVPEALRDSGPETRGRGWSTGFSRLIAQRSDRAQFRLELAKLLQSASTEHNEHSSEGFGAVASPSQLLPSISDRFERWMRGTLNLTAIFGGVGFIIWVEMRRKRARNREPISGSR
jgi:hypothetical protein